MRMIAHALVVCGAVFVGANLVRANALATQAQAAVIGALGELRFVLVLSNDGKADGPVKYKVTKETIKHLNSLTSDGATIVIDAQGKVTIE